DDERERPGLLPAEPPRQTARDVAELGDRLLDATPRVRADTLALVDHPGNCHGRHARDPRHVLDRHVAEVGHVIATKLTPSAGAIKVTKALDFRIVTVLSVPHHVAHQVA